MPGSNKFKKVDKKEFDVFVKNYPNPLGWDVAGMFEPPVGSYNDFSNGKIWPESVVAKVSMEWMGPNDEIDREGHHRFWEYYILEGKE